MYEYLWFKLITSFCSCIYWLSIIGYCLFLLGYMYVIIIWLSVIFYRFSVIGYWLLAIYFLLCILFYKLYVGYLLSIIYYTCLLCYLLSIICHLLSVICICIFFSFCICICICFYMSLSFSFCICISITLFLYMYLAFVWSRQSKRLTNLCGAYANASSICCYTRSFIRPICQCEVWLLQSTASIERRVGNASCQLPLAVDKSQFMRIQTYMCVCVYLIHMYTQTQAIQMHT